MKGKLPRTVEVRPDALPGAKQQHHSTEISKK